MARPWLASAAVSWSVVCGPPVSERLEHAGGGRPQLAGGVGQLGQGGLVGAVEVVARQHGPGALWHPGPAGAAGAAAGAGEDQGRWVAAGWQLAADGLDHQRGQGDLADAGVALGPGLEAAAEPAGLIAGVDDLEDGQGPVQVDAAAAQPGQLPEPQPGAEQAQHVVPPEQRELGEQSTGLLGGEGPALGLVQDLFGVGATPGRGHLAHGIAVDGAFVHGELQDPQHQRPALHEGGVAGAGWRGGLANGEGRPGRSA